MVVNVSAVVVMVIAGAVGVWALVSALRNRQASPALIIASGVLLAALLVQLVLSIIAVAIGGSASDPVLFFGYLITAVVLVPLAGFWAFAELSRWGPIVLVAAALTVIIMEVRVEQLWQ